MNPDDLERFTNAVDDFLEACNEGQDAKDAASVPLMLCLADMYNRYPQKAWRYQGCLFFVQPTDRDASGGMFWRLGVYPDDLIGEIVLT
jgi:hypothetical protein